MQHPSTPEELHAALIGLLESGALNELGLSASQEQWLAVIDEIVNVSNTGKVTPSLKILGSMVLDKLT